MNSVPRTPSVRSVICRRKRRARREVERLREQAERALAVALAERGQVVRGLVLEFATRAAVDETEQERDLFRRLDPLQQVAEDAIRGHRIGGRRRLGEGAVASPNACRRRPRRELRIDAEALDQSRKGEIFAARRRRRRRAGAAAS